MDPLLAEIERIARNVTDVMPNLTDKHHKQAAALFTQFSSSVTDESCPPANYHFVKECVEEGDIDTRRVDTLENIADPMTKALSRQYCERLLPILTGNGDGLPELPPPAKL